jgi:hypothetical protein
MMTFHVQLNLGKSAGKVTKACFTNIPAGAMLAGF